MAPRGSQHFISGYSEVVLRAIYAEQKRAYAQCAERGCYSFLQPDLSEMERARRFIDDFIDGKARVAPPPPSHDRQLVCVTTPRPHQPPSLSQPGALDLLQLHAHPRRPARGAAAGT